MWHKHETNCANLDIITIDKEHCPSHTMITSLSAVQCTVHSLSYMPKSTDEKGIGVEVW